MDRVHASVLGLLVLVGHVFAGQAFAQQASAKTVCALERVGEQLAGVVAQHRGAKLVSVSSPGELLERVDECHAIVGFPGGGIAEQLIAEGTRLEWVQTFSAGVERYVGIPDLAKSDITLTNAKILQGPEIADHAMALLLNLTRGLKFYNAQQSWRRDAQQPLLELREKTMLVIGLGGIGTQIAQRAAAFDMRVIAIDPKDIPLHRDVAYVGKPDELNDLLPEADVVVSAVPHTPSSEGMLSDGQFQLMKDGVYVINISRGRIIDTDALVRALRTGKVSAAGLDVTDPEPLPESHPLWSMPNVIITPHIAGRSDRIESRRLALFRDNVERFLTGRTLRHVVDKARGY